MSEVFSNIVKGVSFNRDSWLEQQAWIKNEINKALAEREAQVRAEEREKVKGLVECLKHMVRQHCEMQDGTLDSMAISANCEAMELLADFGIVAVKVSIGRRCIGEWATYNDNRKG